MEGNKIILPKLLNQDIETDVFIESMQFTIAILHEVNDYIIWEFSTPDEQNVNLLIFKKIFERLQNSFVIKK